MISPFNRQRSPDHDVQRGIFRGFGMASKLAHPSSGKLPLYYSYYIGPTMEIFGLIKRLIFLVITLVILIFPW